VGDSGRSGAVTVARLIFVNRYFHPDHSATSQMVSDLAFAEAARGREVAVVTSGQIYDDPSATLPDRETIGGVSIHRVRTSRRGRAGIAGRALDYLSFYRAARTTLAALVRPGNIVIAKTDPPLLGVAVGRIVRRREGRLVNWLQDLYPEVAAEAGVRGFGGMAGARLAAMRDRSLRNAAVNVAIGDIMADRLRVRGVPAAALRVIPNWADERAVRPIGVDENPLRAEWGYRSDDIVVGYSGNLGRAHEIDTILAAADRLHHRKDIRFLVIGAGHLRAQLEQAARSRGLGFDFRPYQPMAALSESLSVPDIHWVSLRPAFEGLIVPSKLYGIAAAGRPIVAVAAPEGESGRLVTRFDCGVAISPGDGAGLAAVLAALADDPARRARLGGNARAAVEGPLSRAAALGRWAELFDWLAPD
jgi:colanic acid biosynthesis glycosyl transferase WcaI